ncbi:MAG: helix-turn-helix domain-containing protein [Anaerolineae bacterium]|jgi:transcriptional regulator with XRE-family HTH domain
MIYHDLKHVLGHNVQKLRKSLDMTQKELAERTGLNRSYIAGIERGMRNVRLSTIAVLAAAMNVDPEELLKKDN